MHDFQPQQHDYVCADCGMWCMEQYTIEDEVCPFRKTTVPNVRKRKSVIEKLLRALFH